MLLPKSSFFYILFSSWITKVDWKFPILLLFSLLDIRPIFFFSRSRNWSWKTWKILSIVWRKLMKSTMTVVLFLTVLFFMMVTNGSKLWTFFPELFYVLGILKRSTPLWINISYFGKSILDFSSNKVGVV